MYVYVRMYVHTDIHTQTERERERERDGERAKRQGGYQWITYTYTHTKLYIHSYTHIHSLSLSLSLAMYTHYIYTLCIHLFANERALMRVLRVSLVPPLMHLFLPPLMRFLFFPFATRGARREHRGCTRTHIQHSSVRTHTAVQKARRRRLNRYAAVCEHIYVAVCGHIQSSMRTRLSQYQERDTVQKARRRRLNRYVAVCGHIQRSSMRTHIAGYNDVLHRQANVV